MCLYALGFSAQICPLLCGFRGSGADFPKMGILASQHKSGTDSHNVRSFGGSA
jgi:hypothetical protein